MKYILAIVAFTLCHSFIRSAVAEDVVIIESTISGNSEQPKVLSIVPWKEPKLPEYMGDDIQGIGEVIDVFQTVDRKQFNRERQYLLSARKTLIKK